MANLNFVKFEKEYPNYIAYTKEGKKAYITVNADKTATVYGISGRKVDPYGSYHDAFWKSATMSALMALMTSENTEKYWKYYLYVDACETIGINPYSYEAIHSILTFDIKIPTLVKLTQSSQDSKEFKEKILKAMYKITKEEEEFVSRYEKHIIYYNSNVQKAFYTDKKARELIINLVNSNIVKILNSTYAIFGILDEYIENCIILNKEIASVESFWDDYINTKRMIDILESKKESAVFTQYQTAKNLNYSNDEFTIIVPTTKIECIDEGEAMHNCLGRHEWDYYLHNGTRQVVFIRRKSNPNKSYIACDINNNNGDIIQYLTYCNNSVTDEDALNFRAEYQNYLHSIY